MRNIGTIRELWRYAVSSITGELLSNAEVDESGMRGDRLYALVDKETGIGAHPERDEQWRKAIFLRSRTVGERVEIGFPDGAWYSVSSPDLPAPLSDFFGFATAVRPYRRSGVVAVDGLYAEDRYDVSPLHLLTTASVAHLEDLHKGGNADRRRFRPNIFVDTVMDVQGFAELGWLSQKIRLGSVDGEIIAPTKRCGFTMLEQEGIEFDPEIPRNVMRHGGRNMGVYCRPEAGTLRVGDTVVLGD